MTSLGSMLTRNAAEYPDRIGVLQGGRRFSWSEIQDRANRLANALVARGVGKGDRVAFLLQNTHHWVEVTFAALKIGAVLVPLNHRMQASELARVLDECSPSVLISSTAFSGLWRDFSPLAADPERALLVGPSPQGSACYETVLMDASAAFRDREVSGEDLAYVTFTSGTTGFPKGVEWTHAGLLSNIPHNPFPGDLCSRNRELLLAPSFVAGAQIPILNGVCHGATLILMDFHPGEVMTAIEKERPGLMACATVMLRMLADLPNARSRDTGSLERIYYGGSSIGSREAFERIRAVFPCDFQQGYGSAETCILVTRLDPQDHRRPDPSGRPSRLASAGLPVRGAQVKVIGSDGLEVTRGGQIGEIAVKAPWVSQGYWRRPEESARSFTPEGFYLTGDMACVDDEGYLFIVGRRDDRIKTGGLNVYPSEVEAILDAHPAVEESAVFGVDDPTWETALAAAVRLKPGATLDPEDLRSFLRERIASYKVPKRFFFASDPLPRSPLGKVQKGQLKDLCAAQQPGCEERSERKPPAETAARFDPLRHCRTCEFQATCQKFCSKYFQ